MSDLTAREKTIYAFAKVEAWIEQYAKANELAKDWLTNSLAELLTGTGPQPTPKRHYKMRAKVAASLTTTNPKGKGRQGGSSAWWAKMTKHERSVEMRRRMKVRSRNAAAAEDRPKGGVA
jgi:hypothetical protein